MSEENIDQSVSEVEAPEVNSEEQITEEQTSNEVQGESEQESDDAPWPLLICRAHTYLYR